MTKYKKDIAGNYYDLETETRISCRMSKKECIRHVQYVVAMLMLSGIGLGILLTSNNFIQCIIGISLGILGGFIAWTEVNLIEGHEYCIGTRGREN